MLFDEIRNPHVDQDIACLDAVADVVAVLLDVAGDSRVDRRDLEGLDRSRLNDASFNSRRSGWMTLIPAVDPSSLFGRALAWIGESLVPE